MSIRDMVCEWVASGDLIVLDPALDTTPTMRFVFVTKEVREALYGPWDDLEREVRYNRMRAVVDAFVAGARMAVRYPPSRSAKAQIALLDPAADQVWEFRSREPRPGVRLFGSFLEPNTFVALFTELRENIDDDFLKEKERCKREWRRFFPAYRPFSGGSLNSYVTNFHQV